MQMYLRMPLAHKDTTRQDCTWRKQLTNVPSQDLLAAGHASTVLGAFVCVLVIVSALSALALLAPLAKWGALMAFRASAREEMPRHAKRALGPYLWPTAYLNACAQRAALPSRIDLCLWSAKEAANLLSNTGCCHCPST